MKQIISLSFLLLLSLKAVATEPKKDSLVLVPLIKLSYALGKIEENIILKGRIIKKDSAINYFKGIIAHNALAMESYDRDNKAFKVQLAAKESYIELKKGEVSRLEKVEKQDKKKIFTLKVIIVGLIALEVWTLVEH